MKIININLIGELNKAPEYNKAVIKKDNLDAGTKILVIIFIVGIIVTFVTSFGFWFITDNLAAKQRPKLAELENQHQKLLKEQTKLTVYRKNLQNDLKVAKFKKFAKKQTDNTFIPWSQVLTELANKIPKNIIVQDIDKSNYGSAGAGHVNKLNIAGIVPASSERTKTKIKPFTAVSFLILNINEDKDSLLEKAKIKRIEYEDESDVYSFEIETSIRNLQEDEDKKADSKSKKVENRN